MGKIFVAAVVLLALVNAQAQSMPNMRIRGSISAIDGNELQVRTREGTDLNIGITANTKISV